MRRLRILPIAMAVMFCAEMIYAQPQKMIPETLWKFGRLSEPNVAPDAKSIIFGVANFNIDQNKGHRDIYLASTATGEMVNLTKSEYSEYNAVWRPDGKKIGYLSSEGGSSQIWEMNPDGSGKRKISNAPGSITGFKYAPGSKHILFSMHVKLDPTPAEMHPDLPKVNVRIIDDLMYRHWNTWHDYTYSHIFFAPYTDGKLGKEVDIMEGERFHSPLKPYGGIDQIAWSPDGKKIAYTCLKKSGKEAAVSTNSDIYLYDLQTGKTENISAPNPGYDKYPVFSHNGKKIAWLSMPRAGFESDKTRIMIKDFETGKLTDYTADFDQSSKNLVWAEGDNQIFFISGIHATHQVYSLNIADKKITQITKGVHDYHDLAYSSGLLVGAKMSMSMPTELFIVEPASGKEKQLTFINKELLSTLEMGKVEERWIPTTDGKKMLVWVIYPPFFDANKKYPALLYCQGGPQSAVSQFFSYRWNFQIMAAHDYIIVAPNRRGLPSFGQEWNDQISGDYGGQNMQDYLSAIDALAKEPFVDENKLGAVGASYGGFSVFWLAGNHDKRFKAFISHNGMYNLESQYGGTEEYFFVNWDLGGAYWETPKPKSYEFSPHKFVDKWDTPILIVAGEHDYRIPYTEGMQAFHAAQLRGVPSRFLFFPDETHFVLKPQNSILWQRVFFEWLDKWLK